jgi:hypothetical protein
MPGLGLLIGAALVVMCLALLSIWRRERLHGPTRSRAWLWFYRVVTVLLVVFVGYLVVGSIIVGLISRDPGTVLADKLRGLNDPRVASVTYDGYNDGSGPVLLIVMKPDVSGRDARDFGCKFVVPEVAAVGGRASRGLRVGDPGLDQGTGLLPRRNAVSVRLTARRRPQPCLDDHRVLAFGAEGRVEPVEVERRRWGPSAALMSRLRRDRSSPCAARARTERAPPVDRRWEAR